MRPGWQANPVKNYPEFNEKCQKNLWWNSITRPPTHRHKQAQTSSRPQQQKHMSIYICGNKDRQLGSAEWMDLCSDSFHSLWPLPMMKLTTAEAAAATKES